MRFSTETAPQIICATLPLLDLDTKPVEQCESSEQMFREVGRLALQKLRPSLEPRLPRCGFRT